MKPIENIDDPRLTAWVLGELEDEESQAVAAFVAGNEAARRAADEVRATAAALSAELQGAGAPALTEAQRRRIEEALRADSGRGTVLLWLRPALAAGILIALAWGFFGPQALRTLLPEKEEPLVARNAPEPGLFEDPKLKQLGYLDADAGALHAEAMESAADVAAEAPGERPPENALVTTGLSDVLSAGGSKGKDVSGGYRKLGSRARMPQVALTGRGKVVRGLAFEHADSRFWYRETGAESYEPVPDQIFRSVLDQPLSTFAVDVDTGAYANVRRFLNAGQLPPRDAVRIEELINYFSYGYAGPDIESQRPFAVHVETGTCPWASEHLLVRIGLKGRELPAGSRPPANLVFLLDVSGSMNSPDKLPLLQAGLKLMVKSLQPTDRVAIVTYAGRAAVVLKPTACDDKTRILDALAALQSGGSTNGAGGIQMAYELAQNSFVQGGVNRVILCTDGDFNVGVSDRGELQRIITQKAKGGVFLTVLGFGTGNLKDSIVEALADRGNGHYAYIDTLSEARKVLVEEAGSTLVTIAKDVKLQVEFNPGQVAAYRLIGYVNRTLAARDFNDDKKDAGEIGAGHTVTALYEVVPVGVAWEAGTDPLKYQRPRAEQAAPELVESDELLNVKLRFKAPDSDTSEKIEVVVMGDDIRADDRSDDFRFAAAVARFGLLLRDGGEQGGFGFDEVAELAEAGRGADPRGYRAEFLRLVRVAQDLAVR